jgi:type IV secretory pathway VirB10-like protein
MAEPDNSFASSAVPEVQNRTSKPPGILPKNAQTWIVLGVAVVMILVISFSNAGTPKPKTREWANRQTSTTATQNRIDEYRAMVDEEARRLAAERQKAEQARAQVQAAATAMQMPPQPFNPAYAGTQPNPYQTTYGLPPPSAEETQRVALENERRKREYASLFSSNVSLSFRRDQAGKTSVPTAVDAEEHTLRTLHNMEAQLNALRSAQGSRALPSNQSTEVSHPPNAAQAAGTTSAGPDLPKRKVDNPELQNADGKKYRLFEGSILECVLTNRLDGSFSGPVNVMLTTSVYSHDRQRLLIPQGTRILGEVRRVNSFGQQRMAVFFHRMIMPDGYSASLDQFDGLNQIGETGLRDKVNRHYLQTFGVSLAVGAIAGLAQANTQYGFDISGADAYRQGVSASLSQSSLRILDRYLNILPTFTVREGHRIKVHLTNDLLLPAYVQHQLASDL